MSGYHREDEAEARRLVPIELSHQWILSSVEQHEHCCLLELVFSESLNW
jgi:hypothetical protein